MAYSANTADEGLRLYRFVSLASTIVALIAGGFGFAWTASFVYGLFGVGEDGLLLAVVGWSSVFPIMAAVTVMTTIAIWLLEIKEAPVRTRKRFYLGGAAVPWLVFVLALLKWWPRESG